MALSLRANLLLISGAAALALGLLISVDFSTGRAQALQMAELEQQYLPKLELGPRLRVDFERLVRAMQDAVAAQDDEALEATGQVMTALAARIDGSVLDPAARAALGEAISTYYSLARDVSRRMIAGEGGEDLLAAMREMQSRRHNADRLLDSSTRIDRAELAATFAALEKERAAASELRMIISGSALAVVLLLSLWAGRRVLGAIAELSRGLVRVTEGELNTAVAVAGDDEIGRVAGLANRMTARLRELAEDQTRRDWSKSGELGLAAALQGELEPADVARRAVGFLVDHLGALAGACYLLDDAGALRLVAHRGLDRRAELTPTEAFLPGEGLVGDALAEGELRVIDALEEGRLVIRGGLADVTARALIQVPIVHLGQTLAVVELLALRPLDRAQRDFLTTIRPSLGVSLEVARQRAARAALLVETQRQANDLAAQEEELRAANEELQSQQEELRHSNDELLAQTQALETARQGLALKAQELATVSSYKSQFVASMSHELRTPLNSMLLLSSLLADNDGGNLTGKQVEHARIIHSAGQDLLELINQVLDMSRIESGRQDLRPEPVEPRELLAGLARTYSPLAENKGLVFELRVAADLPPRLRTDRRRVEQILTNFLGNAIKFTEQGRITLAVQNSDPAARDRHGVRVPPGWFTFSVTDTGPGISEADRERVFLPFEQLERTVDRRLGGTGLGLAIAGQLAQALGGELGVTSKVGAGSTFYLWLPPDAAPDAESVEAPLSAALETSVRAPTAPGLVHRVDSESGELLLVIEDDPTFAEVVCDVAAARRLSSLVAATGEAGLELARQSRPAGIVLDLRLPDIDGLTVLRRLQADPLTSAIPVHIVSAIDAGDSGFALGAIGYVTKPASRDEILRVLDTLVPKQRSERRVLIVEDDETLGTSLVAMLDGQDIQAARVTSAAGALQALAAAHYGAVVLDLGLPDMDGLELLEQLRQRPGGRALPVIVYTGRALSKAEVRRLESYAEAVVLKEGRSLERLLDELRLFLDQLDGAPGRERPVVAPLDDRSLAGRSILIVDDDMRAVYALSTLLRARGMEVAVADNGRVALEHLGTGARVDAVLMDIMMPEMDGYEAMRRIRAEGRWQKLPIIAFTAKAMKGDRDKCLSAGASDYMAKPVDGDRLILLLKAWLAPAGRDANV